MASWELTEEGGANQGNYAPTTEKLLYYRHNTSIVVHACPSVLISWGIPPVYGKIDHTTYSR